jgi:hypothetical protein
MSDSFQFSMIGVPMELVLQVAAADTVGQVNGWVEKDGSLFLYWADSGMDGYTVLPAPLPIVDAQPLVEAWLKYQWDNHPPKKPDIDGHCERGFRAARERGASNHWGVLVRFSPEWLVFHK